MCFLVFRFWFGEVKYGGNPGEQARRIWCEYFLEE